MTHERVERPDPTIVTRDPTAIVPAVCIVILGVLLLAVLLCA